MLVRSTLTLAALVTASTATADITAVAGMTTLVGAPAMADQFGLNGPNAYAFKEKQNFVIAATPVDMVNNPGNSGAPVAGAVVGLVDSHMIHFAPLNSPTFQAIGSVTFDGPIIGVSFTQPLLDVSDGPAGAGGTIYPTDNPIRSTQAPSFFSINANVLTFDLFAMPGTADFEQIRVFTRPIPAPGSMALLGLGGLLAATRRRGR